MFIFILKTNHLNISDFDFVYSRVLLSFFKIERYLNNLKVAVERGCITC